MIRCQRFFSRVCSLKDPGKVEICSSTPSWFEATTIRFITNGQIDVRNRNELTTPPSEAPWLHDLKDTAHEGRLRAVLNSPIHLAPESDKTSPSEWKTVYELFRLHNSSLDVSKGHMIQARILSIDKRKVTLDTGIAIAKVAVTDITPDCILKPIDDKKPRKLGEIRVGDVVQVFLERKETPEGDMLVSGQQAAVQRRVRAVWKELQNRMHNDKKVKGRILNAVSGGFAVGVGGLVCFLPNSMATKATSRKVGELQYFRILQMNPARSNVVLQDWAFHAWKAKPSGNVKRQNVKMEADSLLKDVQKL